MIMPNKLEGKEAIRTMMKWSMDKLNRKKNEMMDAGYLFYDYVGCPKQKKLCAWDTELIRYTALKGAKKELI